MRICFDIGGTTIKYGLAYEENGNFRLKTKNETATEAKQSGGAGIEEKILSLTKEMKAQEEVDGVAISTAGMVDTQTGAILYANENIPDYTGRNLKKLVETEMQLPCTVENDVNCAAFGETVYGAARGAKSVLCVTVGTGIGGAIILDGAIWHGHSGSAGEIGYMPMNGGTLEELASTTALIRRVKERCGKSRNGYQIFEEAKKGDPICIQAIEEMCEYLGKGLAGGICLFNPEALVLGGGVMEQREYLQPLMEKSLKKYVKDTVLAQCRLTFAELKNSAGMAGAFAVFEHTEKMGLQ
jgi:predicted NBD/HSP70 family sugar kinase